MRNALRILAAVLSVAVASPLARAQERPGPAGSARPARLQGKVTDRETGAPIAEVAIILRMARGAPQTGAEPAPRLTNERGLFVFPAVRPGMYTIEISRIGYETLRDSLEVEADAELRMLVQMSVSAVELEPITVTAWVRTGEMGGFHDRRRAGLGTYITREDIEARNPLYVSDLLRATPGVRVVPLASRGGGDVRLRGGCRPDVFVDGVLTAGGLAIDDFLGVEDVEAIEVYRGPETPAQFKAGSCGAVVVWTRVPRPVPGKGSFWKRLAIATAFLAMGYFLTR